MILIDSCVWIGLLDIRDAIHQRAVEKMRGLNAKDIRINDHVFGELLGVFRKKKMPDVCENLMRFMYDLEIKIDMTSEKVFKLAASLFIKYKNLSFADSLILAKAKIEKLDLLTFDKALLKAWEEVK